MPNSKTHLTDPPPSCRTPGQIIYSILLKKEDRPEENIADLKSISFRPQRAFILASDHDLRPAFFGNGSKLTWRPRFTTTTTQMEIRFVKDKRARFAGSLDANRQIVANPSGSEEPPEIGEDFPGGGPLVVDVPPEEGVGVNSDPLGGGGNSDGSLASNTVDAQASGPKDSATGNCALVRRASSSGKGTLSLGMLFLFAGILGFRKKLTS